jgi:hypothetical protein
MENFVSDIEREERLGIRFNAAHSLGPVYFIPAAF